MQWWGCDELEALKYNGTQWEFIYVVVWMGWSGTHWEIMVYLGCGGRRMLRHNFASKYFILIQIMLCPEKAEQDYVRDRKIKISQTKRIPNSGSEYQSDWCRIVGAQARLGRQLRRASAPVDYSHSQIFLVKQIETEIALATHWEVIK